MTPEEAVKWLRGYARDYDGSYNAQGCSVADLIESQAARIAELERLLAEARDEVSDSLNHALPMAGYPKPDREIAYLTALLARIDAAMQASPAPPQPPAEPDSAPRP